MIKPLFRWAGSKNKMKTKYGSDFMPNKGFDRFVDAFFGTGCVSMWMPDHVEIIANDFNSDIINIYRTIQTDVKGFCDQVDALQGAYIPLEYESRRTYYYDLRQKHADEYHTISDSERAAILFFLLKTSFNGIWQVNKNTNGKFGTPVGLANEKEKVYDKQNVLNFSVFSQRVTFLAGDFGQIESYVTPSSFCYFDPPYRDSFTNYGNVGGFSDNDQIRMCSLMQRCSRKGALVAMSNKYHYDGFFEANLTGDFLPIIYDVTYTAGRGAKNGEKVKVNECLFRNYTTVSKMETFLEC